MKSILQKRHLQFSYFETNVGNLFKDIYKLYKIIYKLNDDELLNNLLEFEIRFSFKMIFKNQNLNKENIKENDENIKRMHELKININISLEKSDNKIKNYIFISNFLTKKI